MGKLILFDFDGTLADTLEIFHPVFAQACAERGFTRFADREAYLRLFDGNLFSGLSACGVPPDQQQAILSSFGAHFAGALDAVALFPGVPEMLQRLAPAATLMIITSSPSAPVWSVLARNEIRVIKAVWGGDVERSKVVKIRRALDAMDADEGFYVGDTTGDIQEGHAAGVTTVGVSWGWHGAERMAAACPDFLADTPEDVIRFLL